MTEPPFLENVGKDIVTLRGLMQKAIKSDIDPGVREYLAELDQAIAITFGKVQEQLPLAEKARDEHRAALQQTADRLESELNDLERKIADLERAAAAPPPGPPAPLAHDPRLGKLLRDELVERFGPKRVDGKAARVAEGDVAELSSGEFRSIEKPPDKPQPPKAAPPAPKAAPPKPKGPTPRRKPTKDAEDESGEWTRDA